MGHQQDRRLSIDRVYVEETPTANDIPSSVLLFNYLGSGTSHANRVAIGWVGGNL